MGPAVISLALWSGTVAAGPGDIFGLGAGSLGRGGGGVAFAEGAEAAWLNPAALAGQPHNSFFAGYQAIGASFEPLPPLRWDTNIDGRIDDTDDPLVLGTPGGRADGVGVGIRARIGGRVGVGLAAFMPKDRLVRISSMEPSLPDYFLYNRRLETYQLAAGLGVDVARGVRLGAGAQLAAGADVLMAGSLRVAVQGAEEGDSDASQLVGGTTFDLSSVDLDVYPKVIPVAAVSLDMGALLAALDGVHLAGTWRGSGGIPVDIVVNLEVDASVEDVGDLEPITLALLADLQLAFLDHAIPSRWTAGGAYEMGELAVVTIDVTGTRWSAVVPSVANVDEDESSLQSPLFQADDPSISDGNAYTLALEDTIAVRVGGEISPLDREVDGKIRTLRLTVRGGWGYEPSPLVSQGASSAFLDADRMLVAGGLGVEHGDPFGKVEGPVSWDLFVQGHLLASGELQRKLDDPYVAGAPVDGVPIPIGGRLWTAGLQWSLEY